MARRAPHRAYHGAAKAEGLAHRLIFLRPWAVIAFCPVLFGRQPFLTDDADVPARGKFHLEVTNQFSILQRSAFPNLRQNAVVFQLNYGLLEGLELGVDSPWIAIFNS